MKVPVTLAAAALGLVLAPLLLGLINRVKARFAGRNGKPLLQAYFDLVKLARKGAVFSETTTWVFRAGPVVVLSTTLLALALTPFFGHAACAGFEGDFVLWALLLGLGRFMMMAAALDTGSSFEGMGASRDALYSALAEPALFLSLASLARLTGELSLSSIYAALPQALLLTGGPVVALVFITMLAVFVVENARLPVDDPATHLELTMIHEVMILDHSGPDLAFYEYAAALKHWILAALIAGLLLPGGGGWEDLALGIAGIFSVALLVGVLESIMARLRLIRVPQLIVGAAVLAAIALLAGGK